MEDEFTQFATLIQENYVDKPSDKSEVATKILKYKSRIEYLGFLQQFLERALESDQYLFTTFNFMMEIVKLRGCLLSSDELIEHFMFIKQFILDNHQRLLSTPVVIKNATQDLAYTIRITFEQDIEKGDFLINNIKEFFDSEEGGLQVVALYAMASLVDCFKEPLSHDTFTENNNYKKRFEQTYLQNFTKDILPLIIEGTEQILFTALELLLHCFQFFENPNSMSVSVNSFQGCFSSYFSESNVLERIIQLCLDSNELIVPLSYKILSFMASASNVWDSPASKVEYFNCFSQSIISIIDAQDENSENIDQTCIILNLLGKNLYGEQFFENAFAQQFFESTLRFSCIVFTKTDPSSLHNIFIFWTKISDWDLPQEFSQVIMFQLIGNFIDNTLTSISQNGEEWTTLFETEYNNYGFESIWKIAHSCYNQVYDLVVEKISAIASESPSNLLQMAFLVMIVTSRFGIINNSQTEGEEEDNAPKMYRVIIDLIDHTNSMVKQMFAEDPAAPIFENSLVIFMNKYQMTHFAGAKPAIAKSKEEKDDEQDIINKFISRILNEFDSFSFISGFPFLIEKIFELVDYIVKKDDCRKLISKTVFEEGLFNQCLAISFEGVPPSAAKRPRIKLYYLYTSLIKSMKNLQSFLGKFDARFQEIASSGYSDQDEIFALFCDLRGVFKFLLRNANQSSADDIRKKYIRVCNWFSTDHVQDSIEIIKNNASNEHIVNIVCNAWISLFPDRFDQQKKKIRNQQPSSIIDNFDGFGIILFKTLLLITDTVSQSCANDVPKYSILFKVIRYCLTTKYTNFGVMIYYEDDSFTQMCSAFFHMLESIDFDTISGYRKVLNNILLTMSAITESEKCLDALFESEDKANLGIIITFTEKCMNLDSHTREVQNKEVLSKNLRESGSTEKNTISNRDLWASAWNVLQPVLNKAISTESVQIFQPHSILILNSAMMKYDEKEINLGPILLASFVYDDQFIKWLIELIVGCYDERFQKYVKDQFISLFNYPVPEPIFENFTKRLKEFSSGFRKYQNDFIDIPEVAKYL